MVIRECRPEDEENIRQMHSRFGYEYPCPEDFSTFRIVENDYGQILMAAGWKLVPEMILVVNPDIVVHPLVRLKGIAMLHEALRSIISSLGFGEAVAFTAPTLKRFGRHLQREFGWFPEWDAFRIHVRKGP